MTAHNHAAFAREDIEDAKRDHPDFDLRDYAARHPMEYLDHGTPAGFGAALPGKPELSWTGNAMVGDIDAFCAAAAAVIREYTSDQAARTVEVSSRRS